MQSNILKAISIFGICTLGFLLFQACDDDNLESLDFFEVGILLDAGSNLGELTVVGNINNGNTTLINQQGFYWATDLVSLSPPTINTKRIDASLDSDGKFRYVWKNLSPDSVYYFRSFAEGEVAGVGFRNVLSPIKSFLVSTKINLIDAQLDNNSVTLKAAISGLDSIPSSIEAYGMLISPNPDPSFDSNGSLPNGIDSTHFSRETGNIIFENKFEDLSFNTTYYYKAWGKVGNGYFYSDRYESINVRDGWLRISDFPTTLTSSVGMSSINNGYVVSGLINYPNVISSALYRFDPVIEEWETIISEVDRGLRREATAQISEDSFYIALGCGFQPNEPNCNSISGIYKYNLLDGVRIRTHNYNENLLPNRESPISFIIGDKIYVGTGVDTDAFLYMNSFIEFDTKTANFQTITPLPTRSENNVDIDKGRAHAIAFVIGDSAYVGLGINPNESALRDLYQFTPPTNENPMGSWTFHSFFPGSQREDAVVVVIGNKAYMGTGDSFSEGSLKDWWEFNPAEPPFWKEKTPFKGVERSNAVAFSINDKAYVGTGERKVLSDNGLSFSTEVLKDFWKYIPEEE